MSVRIIGLGNILVGDDGIGIRVVEELRKVNLPVGVEVIDGGNCGLGLLSLMEGAQKVILVDAVDCDKEPGSIIKLGKREFKLLKEKETFSSHHLSILQALELADILSYNCDMLIIGVKPDKLELGIGLSPGIENIVPQVVDTVLAQLPDYEISNCSR